MTCWPELLLLTPQTSHQLYDHVPSGRLKSRNSFMRTATQLDSSPNYTILQMWNNQLTYARATINLGLETTEALSAGSDQQWLCWRSLNGLRTAIVRAKTTMRRWSYIDNTQSVNCDCGEPQTMPHLLCCWLLDEPSIASRKTSPHNRQREGKGVCPEVATHCVKDTTEQDLRTLFI